MWGVAGRRLSPALSKIHLSWINLLLLIVFVPIYICHYTPRSDNISLCNKLFYRAMLFMLTILGGLLPVFYAIFRHWKRTHVKVNCWFCGLNTTILKTCTDGWMCQHCEQYNGFKSDGDYNRDIPAQWDSSVNGKLSFCSRPSSHSKHTSNGFCQECNRNQELKIAQLASFQPINPENFDQEIENFSYHLERAYRLCPSCENVLEETLSHKKTHVLDMNLQMTGRKTQNGIYSSPKHSFVRTLVMTSAFVTAIIAATISLSSVSTLPYDHVLFKFSDFIFNKQVLSVDSQSYPVSSLSYFLPPTGHVCLQQEARPSVKPVKPFSKLFNGSFDMYLESLETLHLPLCFSGLALQGVSSWLSSSGLSILLWAAFVGMSVVYKFQLATIEYVQIFQLLQIVLAALIMVLSLQEMARLKPKSSSSSKKQPRNISLNLRRGKSGSNLLSEYTSPNEEKRLVQPGQGAVNAILPRTSSVAEIRRDTSTLEAPNYLTLPIRSPSVSSSHTLTSAAALNNSLLSSNVDIQSIGTQEDAKSDASVDSAFSNADSVTLDAPDPFNSSQFSSNRNRDSQDDEVHSLIESLSIGSLSSKRSFKKSSEIQTGLVGKDRKRSSLLSPPKLTNIMNESMRSGIWRNTRSNIPTNVAADVPQPINQTMSESFNQTLSRNQTMSESFNQTLSRPSSPCGSVRSQATVQSLGTPRNFSPPSSFQPISPAWNPPASPQNSLSVCVPPNPLATNHGFGNLASPIPNPPMSQVIYTPYGVYHQMVGPFGNPVYMMSPHSPAPFNRSPSSSYGSQFSPQSFSTSSRFCDSDTDFSPKSSKGKMKTKSTLSSSFLESVWQSRFAIMYTTLCYLLLGSIVFVFSYSGIATNVFSKVISWKQEVFSSIS